MRHLPNALTLANLFFGCCAIACTLAAQNFSVTMADPMVPIEVPGTAQPYLGALFIGLATVCDALDGLAARALRVHSPLGADLDSLADLVSFGVAPAMILFQMLWLAAARAPEAMDVSLWSTAPAFLVAVFAALRLARFNVAPARQSGDFEGMPTPAVGIFVASLALVQWYNPRGLGAWLGNYWVLTAIIAGLCWAMISRVRFLKGIPSTRSAAALWPGALIVLTGAALLPLIGVAAIPAAFLLYVLLSVLLPKSAAATHPAPDAQLQDAQP